MGVVVNNVSCAYIHFTMHALTMAFTMSCMHTQIIIGNNKVLIRLLIISVF